MPGGRAAAGKLWSKESEARELSFVLSLVDHELMLVYW